jgi:hypothetical protein
MPLLSDNSDEKMHATQPEDLRLTLELSLR